MKAHLTSVTFGTVFAVFFTGNVFAETILDEIVVTAQKREQNIQDVPLSISTLSGKKLASKFSGGEDILAISGTVPSLYIESSNGRTAPRFYLRGLGNADFDQAASQPVSIVFDEVPVELVALKSFPLFDQAAVEVIRGPQGSLFGRNTSAGIIKFDSEKPSQEFNGYAKLGAGNMGTVNAEAAVGGSLIDGKLSGRLSFFTQNRSDWIDNAFTNEDDAIGGFSEFAGRVQLLWTPTEDFSVWIMHQRRDQDGNTGTAFRANILTTGSNELNQNFDRDTVFYDGGGGNPAEVEGSGTTVKLDWDIGDYTLTAITSYHETEQFARGDIDGGFGAVFAPPFGPGFIPFPADTGGNNSIEQWTQEIRLASHLDGPLNYQVGAFYFSDELSTSTEFGIGPNPRDLAAGAIALQENEAWAIFGQGTYDLTDRLILTAGLRYSDDSRNYTDVSPVVTVAPISLSDTNVSWNVSLDYAISDNSKVYTRVAKGFRAPQIQSRNVAFGAPVSTADSETILSFEIGYKATLWDRLRLSGAIFYYDIDDLQLTALGGATNSAILLNANGGEGYGIEIELDYVVTENLILSGGFGYNKTSIEDENLTVAVCGSGQCTPTDPLDANGNAFIDGNPFQHAPDWTLNVELDYSYPLSNDTELFLYTDWKVKGPTNDFLYKTIEYDFDTQFEGGLSVGYRDNIRNYDIAFFARNITDEENPIGGIDFNNLTSYVNQPRVWGVEASYRF